MKMNISDKFKPNYHWIRMSYEIDAAYLTFSCITKFQKESP